MYNRFTVASGKRSVPQLILLPRIMEIEEVEDLEKAERVCVCDRE